MTVRRTLITGVVIALACGTVACSSEPTQVSFAPADAGSGADLDGQGAVDTGPPGTTLPRNVNEAALRCITEQCDVTTCGLSEGCVAGVQCMATCGDAVCAEGCLEGTSDDDRAALQGVLVCASFAGCFDAEPPGPSCGDGVCEDGEDADKCPEDCMETGPTCGDGVCEEGEGPETCPQDCADEPTTSCLEDNCEIGQCQDFQVCMDVLTCINACETADCATACLAAAPGPVTNILGDALECAVEKGCFEDAPPPPPDDCLLDNCDAGNCAAFPACLAGVECMSSCESAACAELCILDTPDALHGLLFDMLVCGIESECLESDGTVCGDGWCVPPESTDSCPEDCGPGEPVCGDGVCEPGENCPEDCEPDSCGDGVCEPNEDCPQDCTEMTPLFSCLSEDCPLQWAACLTDDVCSDALPCLNACVEGGGTGCTYQCMPDDESDVMLELGMCGGEYGCGNICGDGECDPGESATSCPEDCAPDEPTCGDGICSLGEDCPEDCDGMTPLFGCLSEECPEQWADCQQDDGCQGALPCLNACVEAGETGCTYQCMPDNGNDTLLELGMCGGENGCGNICGDGECDPGEDNDTCPEDCQELDPDCGDGECADDETEDSCPEDCDPGEPVCGDGQCAAAESEDTCPEDCGPGEPVCGDGQCADTEDGETCPEDCGPGPQPECGDGQCEDAESCAQCPDDCGACGGSCCEPHDGGGCQEITCQQTVCSEDPDCCYEDWTEGCVELANTLCPVCDPTTVCGDDECTDNENPTNCPEDCNGLPNDFLSCVAGVCGDELEACFDDPDCSDAFPCLEECVNNGGEGCTVECMPAEDNDALWNLGICAGGNGCGNNCGDGFCGPGETAGDCPGDCDGGLSFYGVLITDVWDGQCSQFNAAGTDIDAVELLSCADDDPDSCTTVAFFETVVAEVGTDACANDYTDPMQTVGEVDGGQLALQGGWVAGEFGTDGPMTSGMIVRVHEFGQAYGGSDDPYTVSLITDLSCAESDDLQACSLSLGDGLGLADFVIP